MLQKKICMLGAYGVGKTSLVSRFVSSMFSDKYLTTIGVKIDKKTVSVDGGQMTLILWDIYGEDDFQKIRMSYVRGAGGYVLVADGTRRATLDTACAIHETVTGRIGAVPFVLLINKSDLADQWQIDDASLAKVAQRGWRVIRTSAKTGGAVEDAFLSLARSMAIS